MLVHVTLTFLEGPPLNKGQVSHCAQFVLILSYSCIVRLRNISHCYLVTYHVYIQRVGFYGQCCMQPFFQYWVLLGIQELVTASRINFSISQVNLKISTGPYFFLLYVIYVWYNLRMHVTLTLWLHDVGLGQCHISRTFVGYETPPHDL